MDAFGSFRSFRRVVKADSDVSGPPNPAEAKVDRFLLAIIFLRLLSLEEHQWRIIPHRNASAPWPQRLVVKFYNHTNTMRFADDTPGIRVHAA